MDMMRSLALDTRPRVSAALGLSSSRRPEGPHILRRCAAADPGTGRRPLRILQLSKHRLFLGGD